MGKISIVVPDTAELVEWLASRRGKIGGEIPFIDQYPQVAEKGAYLDWWNDRWNRWNKLLQPYNRYHSLIERVVEMHEECQKILSACEHFNSVQAKMRLYAFSKENDLSREEILLMASRLLRKLDNHALAMMERLKTLKNTLIWLEKYLPHGEPRRLYASIYATARCFIGEFFGANQHFPAQLRRIDAYLRSKNDAETYDRLDSEYRRFYDAKDELESIRHTLQEQGEALMPLMYEAVELRSDIDAGFSWFVGLKKRVLVDECDQEPVSIDYAPIAAWVDKRNVTVMFTTGKLATLPLSRYYRLKTFPLNSERVCSLSPVFVMFPDVNVTIHIEEFLNEYGEPIFPAGSQKDWLIKNEKRREYQIGLSESHE
ncbi:TPA: hypothetical protein JG871_003913 [Enterobacter hormaechei subsp. xiangfangensis]|nr:hypothetical protein [Enterobacter hormaechei subsp. xiangfangensis]